MPAVSSAVAGAARTRCTRLAVWGNAVLLGTVSPDAAAEQVGRGDPPHRLGLSPGAPAETLPVALARLAGTGVDGVRLLLPAPGDPVGLPGPGPFATGALDLGAGVLLTGPGPATGLLPVERPGAVHWRAEVVPGGPLAPAWPAGLPSLAEADRDLAAAVREATALLAGLDLARLDPDVAPALAALRDGRLDGEPLPACYPPQAQGVLARGRRLAALVDLARATDGAAVTAGESAARRAALDPLDRAARRAVAAACNAVLEPPR